MPTTGEKASPVSTQIASGYTGFFLFSCLPSLRPAQGNAFAAKKKADRRIAIHEFRNNLNPDYKSMSTDAIKKAYIARSINTTHNVGGDVGNVVYTQDNPCGGAYEVVLDKAGNVVSEPLNWPISLKMTGQSHPK